VNQILAFIHVRLMPGCAIGIPAQEPALNEGKTVFDDVSAGAGAAALARSWGKTAATGG
jgi:hypothetical protein